MLILGIESATSQVGCALGGPDGLIASAHTVRPRHHAESLAPQIDFIIDQAGVALSDVDAIAIDIGPGLFTGLRVGITTAISMAWTLGVPVITSTSLDLLAHRVMIDDREILAVVDARRGEVFHARYRPEGSGLSQITEPAVARPDELAVTVASSGSGSGSGSGVLVVGDGARAHFDVFDALDGVDVAPSGFDRPSAVALVSLAGRIAEQDDFVDPSQVAPLYLREPDAKAKWEPGGSVPS